MIIKNVTFYIKPEFHKEFIDATIINQTNSRKEEGVIRFDLLQSSENSNKFVLYEGYQTVDAMELHLETDHFKEWISKVEEWFIKPREKEVYNAVNPINNAM